MSSLKRRIKKLNKKSWITDKLPDSDMTVLMRLQDEENFIWPGYHDGEEWRSGDGFPLEVAVLGWMELEDAASLLDTIQI